MHVKEIKLRKVKEILEKDDIIIEPIKVENEMQTLEMELETPKTPKTPSHHRNTPISGSRRKIKISRRCLAQT
ncbi:hypothetical protein MML48_9g00021866 [Holotrichia oblita]|uniref:Uncharacterized protein n=1 Tax=Holotrichia oblita TaxID=644536 RepID=A0ACB9SI97_HOLOL|nr:hypothetical protein MML48_9g00021866 [Holotrichia oblita]